MKDSLEFGGNGLMYVLTGIQTNDVFRLISLCLSILISILILAEKFYSWYKKAKSDGKISSDEIKELSSNIKEDVKDIKENADEIVEILEIENKEEK